MFYGSISCVSNQKKTKKKIMEISVLNLGTTNLTNKEIETAVQSLSFTMTAVTPAATDAAGILTAILGTSEMNLQKQNGTDTQTLIQSLPLRDLAEICTHNDGVIRIFTSGANTVVSFTIEISNNGALHLDDNSKLLFALSGIPATTSVAIDGIDHPVNTELYIRYESKFVNALVSKDFSIDAAYAIALPIGNLKALELTYRNGKNVKFSKREVEQVLVMSQDPIYNLNGLVTVGFGKYAVLSCEDVMSARVTLDASTNFYLLKNQNI